MGISQGGGIGNSRLKAGAELTTGCVGGTVSLWSWPSSQEQREAGQDLAGSGEVCRFRQPPRAAVKRQKQGSGPCVSPLSGC